ncbi:MAG: NAD+ synthase [Candidatus Methanofastidiosia archaeon]
MRIAVAQINTSVGDLEGNTEKVITLTDRSDLKADLFVFPELTITGYPPRDLVLEGYFIEENKKMLSRIVQSCKNPCIVGFVDSREGNLYNAAAFIRDKTITTQYKMLLPNYDVFDEKRYFTPGETQSLVSFQEKKIGIEICEDLWEIDYPVKPTTHLKKMGADIIINISASPYCVGKVEERLELAKKIDVPMMIYCNLIGGQDELVFDGHSFAISRGNVVKMGKSFEEDIFIIDTEEPPVEGDLTICETKNVFKALALGLKDYCRKTGFQKAVLGLSGGIDSSLVCCLAVEALGCENVTGMFMPSRYTSSQSKEYVDTLVENLGVPLVIIPIDGIFETYRTGLAPLFRELPEDITEENMQARIRGNLLMAYSNKFGHLVLAPGNKTELALGYCTLYGDMSGGLSVIGDVSKMRVYELAGYYNEKAQKEIIPQEVFMRVPSAELKAGQVDPFDYTVVSPLVDLIIEEKKSEKELIDAGYDSKLVDDIVRRIRRSEYKRKQAAPVIKVTRQAFGIGWRYPIANQFLHS